MEVNRVAASTAQAPPPPPPPSVSVDTAARATAQPVQQPQVNAPERPAAERNDRESTVLRRVVNEVNQTLDTYGRHLGIRIHQATGRHMVTVYDSNTNEALREIPPERVLDAHAGLLELAGLLVDRRG